MASMSVSPAVLRLVDDVSWDTNTQTVIYNTV